METIIVGAVMFVLGGGAGFVIGWRWLARSDRGRAIHKAVSKD